MKLTRTTTLRLATLVLVLALAGLIAPRVVQAGALFTVNPSRHTSNASLGTGIAVFQIIEPVYKTLTQTSVYTVTNLGSSTATTEHSFYEGGYPGGTNVYNLILSVPVSGTIAIDLGTLSALPVPFVGDVVISADQPITSTVQTNLNPTPTPTATQIHKPTVTPTRILKPTATRPTPTPPATRTNTPTRTPRATATHPTGTPSPTQTPTASWTPCDC